MTGYGNRTASRRHRSLISRRNPPIKGDQFRQDSPPQMSNTQTSRGRQRIRSLRVLVAACLCVGLQPCAIAAEFCCPAEQKDQPTPLDDAASTAHHHETAQAQEASSSHSGHAQTDVSEDCDSLQPECCAADIGLADKRPSAAKLKVDDQPAALMPVPMGIAPAIPSRRSEAVASLPDPPDPQRALHKIHCVYLD